MVTLGDKSETYVDKLTCDICFKTYKERTGLWRHKKHCHGNNNQSTTSNNLATSDDTLATNSNILATMNINSFTCELCNKTYQHRQGLWRHKKNNNCYNKSDSEYIDKNDKLIEYLMKENKEMKDLILEIVKNGTHNITNNNTNTNTNTNTNNNNNTNSHNKAFNLNFFLNETCKNAMNITDFVDSIKLQLSDLISVGELGYVEGISKIIVNNLNNLDETERPIHCTDKKRETMYIKDENKWSKHDTNAKLKKFINSVTDKNIRLLPKFREKYPEYDNSTARVSDQYNKLMVEVMTVDKEKDEKIFRNISNATTITPAKN
jgi:hypothetical protein